MTFDVVGAAYDRFMGRYSRPLATVFADWVQVDRGVDVLDVGCGPGALTGVLVAQTGESHVTAVDPSAPFVEACRERHPSVEVRRAPAEQLPFPDGRFDVVLAQLVVHFMDDPVAGLAEMARVARPDGRVAACVWDLAGDRSPLSPMWSAARRLDPGVEGETTGAGARQGHLAELAREAGLTDVESTELSVTVTHPGFGEWWEPYTLGVGPAGDHVARLDPGEREQLREECRRGLPDGPFDVTAVAWAVRGRA